MFHAHLLHLVPTAQQDLHIEPSELLRPGRRYRVEMPAGHVEAESLAFDQET